MTRHECIIVFDVGGTVLKSGLAHLGKGLVESAFMKTPMPSAGSKEEIASAFSSAVKEQIRRAAALGEEVAAVAVAVPGPFDFNEGVFLMKHKFLSVYGEKLSSLCGLPLPFRYDHDVNAALRGVIASSPELGKGTVAMATIGTGLGFAYAVDGQVKKSPSGSPAENAYNLPFRGRILEDFVSRRGILEAYASVSTLPPGMDVVDIASLAADGDPAARKVFNQMGEALGEGISPILEKLGADTLVLGGQISKSFPLFADGLRSRLPEGVGVLAVEDTSGAAMRGAAALFE